MSHPVSSQYESGAHVASLQEKMWQFLGHLFPPLAVTSVVHIRLHEHRIHQCFASFKAESSLVALTGPYFVMEYGPHICQKMDPHFMGGPYSIIEYGPTCSFVPAMAEYDWYAMVTA